MPTPASSTLGLRRLCRAPWVGKSFSCSLINKASLGGARGWVRGAAEFHLPNKELEGHQRRDGERYRDGDQVVGGFLQGVGEKLGEDHPDHCSPREAQPDWQERLEDFHEEERGNCHKGLGHTGEDALEGATYAHAARHED